MATFSRFNDPEWPEPTVARERASTEAYLGAHVNSLDPTLVRAGLAFLDAVAKIDLAPLSEKIPQDTMGNPLYNNGERLVWSMVNERAENAGWLAAELRRAARRRRGPDDET